jgi:hypothetical protein
MGQAICSLAPFPSQRLEIFRLKKDPKPRLYFNDKILIPTAKLSDQQE